jgi:hypothetical protein
MMAAEKTSAPTGIEALKKWNQQHPDCTTPWSDDRRRRWEIQRLRDLPIRPPACSCRKWSA